MVKKTILPLAGLILTLFFVPACGEASATSGTVTGTEEAPMPEAAAKNQEVKILPKSDSRLVGISVPDAPTGWVAAVKWSAETNAERLGLEYTLLASEDEVAQADDIDELIEMGCGIIVLFPHNDSLSSSAQKIMDAGITLINFDRTLGNTVPDYYVGGDNRQMGVVGAESIGKELNGKGSVVIVSIPSYGEIFDSRVSGFIDTVAEKYPNIEIIDQYAAERGSRESGAQVVGDILSEHPTGIDAIYSVDDELSSGMIQTMGEGGGFGSIKALTGGGGEKSFMELMDQYPDLAISSQTYSPYMMSTCIEIAAGLLEGETYPQTTIVPVENLTKGNYHQWLNDNNITEDAPY